MKMWTIAIASAAIIGTLLFTQGAIVALSVTALCSFVALLILRIADRQTEAPANLHLVEGNDSPEFLYQQREQAS
jgi:hypothetical protein